jgi:integrase
MRTAIVKKSSLSSRLLQVKARGKESTKTYRSLMRSFEASGHPQTIEGFSEYIEELRATRPAATVNLAIAAGRKAFLQAGELAGMSTKELAVIKMALSELRNVKKGAPQVRTVNPQERGILFDALPYRVRMIAETIYATGCRVSELARLRLAAVKEEDEWIELRIRGKGDKERKVSIPAEMFRRIRATFPEGKEFLFTTSRGNPYGREYISREIARASKRVLGREVRAHQLRHSRATDLYQATGRIKAVKELLGHSDEAITLRYYVRDTFTPEELFEGEAMNGGSE